MKSRYFKQHLKKEGAALVGVGDISKALTSEIAHLDRCIAIAVTRALGSEAVGLVSSLQNSAEQWLKSRGFRYLSIPPDSDRRTGKYIAKLYHLVSHKTAATCSGLGWVGKNGLIINSIYGARLTWGTVLTDAPFEPDPPVAESRCGQCDLCVVHCPSGALKGKLWSLGDPLEELVAYEKCRSLKTDRLAFKEKPNCGFCVTICPYSRQKGSGSRVKSIKT